MKTWLEIQRRSGLVEKRRVREDGTCGRVHGACPGCKAKPFLVKCIPAEVVNDRLIRAGARCCSCNDRVGWVYHRPSTIFGLAEDAAVAARVRVY